MGNITPTSSIDLIIESTPLTLEDRQEISNIIAKFKVTGEIPKPIIKQSNKKHNGKNKLKSKMKKFITI